LSGLMKHHVANLRSEVIWQISSVIPEKRRTNCAPGN